MKKLLALYLVIIAALFLGGCGSAEAPQQEAKILKVGVTSGPHAEILEQVKTVAERDGLKIEIVEFNDYVQPNTSLDQGEIDANAFQHQPFLDNHVKDRGYKLVSIAKTVILPMGIYSDKVKKLDELKDGSAVAIPNDPSNAGRALLLLDQAGLIKLKPGVGAAASVLDIVENPKNLKIKELEAALIPRAIADVDIAAINTSYALKAGLVPARDGLALENSSSPYTNVLAVREKDKDNPVFQKLIKAYHSEEVKKYLVEHFQGSILPGW
ncbi:MetQ/NlpA family ABC transporter substrate-binding protein [Sporomusa termitida]|uniref:Lipoprotein n=1 Tax=Sporomusa termitida TaxID=2377 RepID=A0A517DNG6_9FIRM|nr:MetQ/NlpA family ABC transporter substrate-binding protein [Sporomusa termitida]QDR78910.1 D-methionine-binding lipoprotein MetQ [Sporomusa termitida]